MSEVRALLQTDVVDSTRLTQQLGDAAMAALWASHDQLARELLRQWRGREIDKSDGFLLLFDAVADALGFALAYHRALGGLEVPLQARAGLHVGPVDLRENHPDDVARGAKALEVEGLAKPLTARVMALAQGGQTLLTADARAALGDTGWRVEHRGHWHLKGIEQPIELFEVGDAGAPFTAPPDSEKAYRVLRHDDLWLPLRELRHSLPAERDRFIDRHEPLQQLAERFHGAARLVSLLGIGGTGKTRLAQRFGWTWLGEASGGVWFCDLSQARSLDGLVQAVAQGLDVPLGKADPVTQLGHALAGRGPCLVILDNFEQLVRHAEQTLGAWLERAQQARFLVTSRELLGIPGEQALALDPLGPHDAATLFVQRAGAAEQGFRMTAADEAAIDPLVRLLDGLPLAIELAAARVRLMSPQQLLRRMSERFKLLASSGKRRDRQSTLRHAFDWSWELLSPPEKAALAQLSVFEGGFTLAAAEATLDLAPHDAAAWPLDVLQSLVEKSLVRRRPDGRFEMLTTVQEYAAEHLRTPGRYPGSGAAAVAQAQARHAAHFAHIDPALATADRCADLDNLIVACRRAVAAADADGAVPTLERAWEALRLRGPFRLGVELATSVRAMKALDVGQAARVDRIAGSSLRACGNTAQAQRYYDQAREEAHAAGDRVCEGRVRMHLGDMHINVGNMDDADDELTAALALARDTGDLILLCEVHSTLGNLQEHLGLLAEARQHYEAALDAARQAHDRRWEGGCLGNLGLLCANQGLLDEARALCEAAVDVARELGDRQWEGNTLCNLGLLHHMQGRMQDARSALDQSLRIARDLGHMRLECIVSCNLGIVLEALGAPDEAMAQHMAALEVARDLGDRRSEGQILNYLGLLLARKGRFAESRSQLADAERLLSEVSDRLNLGVVLCSVAEAEFLAGDHEAAKAALSRAADLAAQVDAQPDSELGTSLARASTVLGRELQV